MNCDLCHERPVRETIKGKHVCRPCARTLKPERQARYLKRRTEKAAATKAKEKAEAKKRATKPAATIDEAAAVLASEVQ